MADPPHHILYYQVPHRTPATPRGVPKHWEAEVKAQLDKDMKMGVIEPVPAGKDKDWCARMVFGPVQTHGRLLAP